MSRYLEVLMGERSEERLPRHHAKPQSLTKMQFLCTESKLVRSVYAKNTLEKVSEESRVSKPTLAIS